MKVALIDSPTSHEQIYGDWDLSKVDTYCPPLGLLHIASYIRQFGHSPEVIDIAARKWTLNQAVDHIYNIEPDVIGISAKTINVFNANKIAKQLKDNGLKTPIVIGGSHVTATPVETMQKFDALDFGVVGEGEVTFHELIEKLGQNETVDNIEGIVLRDTKGQPIVNPGRTPIHNLDTLPFPAWDLLPEFPVGYHYSALETKQLPAASIMTSRGCPFKCTFCDHKIFGSGVRHHSAEYSINMIRHLKKKYGISDLMILDDNFILNEKKLFQICDAMIKDKMDMSWYCMGHAKFMTEDRLKKIVEAGCWFIEIGIESGCDRILKILNKNATKNEIADAVKKAKDVGLKIKGNFIFGLPTETKESLEETIKFATKIDLSYFQQNFLTIWPGCELSENPGQFGKFENDWNKLAHQRITFLPHGLTEEDLVNASKAAFRRFYLRPNIIFGILKSLTTTRAIKSFIISLFAFIKTIFR